MVTTRSDMNPEFAALSRVHPTFWRTLVGTIVSITLAFATVAYAVQRHEKSIDRQETTIQVMQRDVTDAKSLASRTDGVVAERIDALIRLEEARAKAFDSRLQSIESFQRAQAEAAIAAAMKRTAGQ